MDEIKKNPDNPDIVKDTENTDPDIVTDKDDIISLDYSAEEARKNTICTFFPFLKEGKAHLYGLIVFIAAAAFFAIPAVISVMALIFPRASVLNFISSRTATFFHISAYCVCALAAWFLIGRIVDCAYNKKKFLNYESFGDFLKKNVVRIMLFVVILLMTISGLINTSNINNAFTNVTDGIFTWYLVALGAILISLVKDEKQMRTLVVVFVISALFTCVVSYIQYVVFYKEQTLDTLSDFFRLWSVDFSKIATNLKNLRHVRGVFSNSNHYGYYLTLSSLACAGLYITGDKLYKRILSMLGFIILIFTMVLNDTLGVQLAIFITVLLLPVAFLRSKTSIFRRFVPIIAMVCVMTFMSLFPQLPIGSMSLRNNVDELGRNIKKITSFNDNDENNDTVTPVSAQKGSVSVSLGNASPSNDKTILLSSEEEGDKEENRWWLKNQELGTSRLGLWQYGIHLIAQKPIFGYGVYGSADLFKNESGLAAPAGRVHNEYLQIAIDCGIPAMLIHLASYVMVVIYFFKAMKKRQLSLIQRILFVMFTAYAISALMGICAYYTASFFYIWLALLISTFEGSFHEYPKEEKKDAAESDESQSGTETDCTSDTDEDETPEVEAATIN